MLVAVLFLFTEICAFPSQTYAKTPPSFSVQGGNHPVTIVGQPQIDEIGRVPPELGSVDEIYLGPRATGHDPRKEQNVSRVPEHVSRKTIVFIQDAHDSLEAQENIAKLIRHFVRTAGVKTVFEEGYEGPVPTDEYFGFIKDPELKRKVSYFFMDHLRIGGAEYAHINRATGHGPRTTKEQNRGPGDVARGTDWTLIGADSLKLHKENIDQYRLSAEKKVAVTKDLKVLEKEVQSLAAKRFPKPLLEWLKLKEQFDAKKLDLFTYLGRTMPLAYSGQRTADSKNKKPELNAERYALNATEAAPLLRFILEAVRSNDPVVIEAAKHIDAREIYAELQKLEDAVVGTYLGDRETASVQRSAYSVQKNQNLNAERYTLNADLQLYHHCKTIRLLERLNDLQVSQEEYASLLGHDPRSTIHDSVLPTRGPAHVARGPGLSVDTQGLAEFIHQQTGRPLVLSRRWEQNIRDAVRFYEISQQRDNSLADAVDKYLLRATGQGPRATENENANSWPGDRGSWTAPAPAVLVYGGFHKENIKRILEAKGISYLVVSPRITKPSRRHEAFYKKLMVEGAFPFEKNLKPLLATAARNPTLFSGVPAPIARAEVRAVYEAIANGAPVELVDRMIGRNEPAQVKDRVLGPGLRVGQKDANRAEMHQNPVGFGTSSALPGSAKSEMREAKKTTPQPGSLSWWKGPLLLSAVLSLTDLALTQWTRLLEPLRIVQAPEGPGIYLDELARIDLIPGAFSLIHYFLPVAMSAGSAGMACAGFFLAFYILAKKTVKAGIRRPGLILKPFTAYLTVMATHQMIYQGIHDYFLLRAGFGLKTFNIADSILPVMAAGVGLFVLNLLRDLLPQKRSLPEKNGIAGQTKKEPTRSEMPLNPVDSRTSPSAAEEGRRSEMRGEPGATGQGPRAAEEPNRGSWIVGRVPEKVRSESRPGQEAEPLFEGYFNTARRAGYTRVIFVNSSQLWGLSRPVLFYWSFLDRLRELFPNARFEFHEKSRPGFLNVLNFPEGMRKISEIPEDFSENEKVLWVHDGFLKKILPHPGNHDQLIMTFAAPEAVPFTGFPAVRLALGQAVPFQWYHSLEDIQLRLRDLGFEELAPAEPGILRPWDLAPDVHRKAADIQEGYPQLSRKTNGQKPVALLNFRHGKGTSVEPGDSREKRTRRWKEITSQFLKKWPGYLIFNHGEGYWSEAVQKEMRATYDEIKAGDPENKLVWIESPDGDKTDGNILAFALLLLSDLVVTEQSGISYAADWMRKPMLVSGRGVISNQLILRDNAREIGPWDGKDLVEEGLKLMRRSEARGTLYTPDVYKGEKRTKQSVPVVPGTVQKAIRSNVAKVRTLADAVPLEYQKILTPSKLSTFSQADGFKELQKQYLPGLIDANQLVLEMLAPVLALNEQDALAVLSETLPELESLRDWAIKYAIVSGRGRWNTWDLLLLWHPQERKNFSAQKILEMLRERFAVYQWATAKLPVAEPQFRTTEERRDYLERAEIAMRSVRHDPWNELSYFTYRLHYAMEEIPPEKRWPQAMAAEVLGLSQRLFLWGEGRPGKTFTEREILEFVETLRLFRELLPEYDRRVAGEPAAMTEYYRLCRQSTGEINGDLLSFVEGDIEARKTEFSLKETIEKSFDAVFSEKYRSDAAEFSNVKISLDMQGLDNVRIRADHRKILNLYRILFMNSKQVWLERNPRLHEEPKPGEPPSARPPLRIKVAFDREQGEIVQEVQEITDNAGGIHSKDQTLFGEVVPGRQRAFLLNVSRRTGDTGLGLAEVWWLVRLHGGTIKFSNILEGDNVRGAKFSIKWPVSLTPVATPTTPRSEARGTLYTPDVYKGEKRAEQSVHVVPGTVQRDQDAIAEAVSRVKIDTGFSEVEKMRGHIEMLLEQYITPGARYVKGLLSAVGKLNVFTGEKLKELAWQRTIIGGLLTLAGGTVLFFTPSPSDYGLIPVATTALIMGNIITLHSSFENFSGGINWAKKWLIMLNDNGDREFHLTHELGHIMGFAINAEDEFAEAFASLHHGPYLGMPWHKEKWDPEFDRISHLSVEDARKELQAVLMRHRSSALSWLTLPFREFFYGRGFEDYELGAFIGGAIRKLFQDDPKGAFEFLVSVFKNKMISRAEMPLNPVDSRTSQSAAEEGRRSEMREIPVSDLKEILNRNDRIFREALKNALETSGIGAEEFERDFLVFYAGSMAYGDVRSDSDIDYLLIALPDGTGQTPGTRKGEAKALTEKIDGLLTKSGIQHEDFLKNRFDLYSIENVLKVLTEKEVMVTFELQEFNLRTEMLESTNMPRRFLLKTALVGGNRDAYDRLKASVDQSIIPEWKRLFQGWLDDGTVFNTASFFKKEWELGRKEKIREFFKIYFRLRPFAQDWKVGASDEATILKAYQFLQNRLVFGELPIHLLEAVDVLSRVLVSNGFSISGENRSDSPLRSDQQSNHDRTPGVRKRSEMRGEPGATGQGPRAAEEPKRGSWIVGRVPEKVRSESRETPGTVLGKGRTVPEATRAESRSTDPSQTSAAQHHYYASEEGWRRFQEAYQKQPGKIIAWWAVLQDHFGTQEPSPRMILDALKGILSRSGAPSDDVVAEDARLIYSLEDLMRTSNIKLETYGDLERFVKLYENPFAETPKNFLKVLDFGSHLRDPDKKGERVTSLKGIGEQLARERQLDPEQVKMVGTDFILSDVRDNQTLGRQVMYIDLSPRHHALRWQGLPMWRLEETVSPADVVTLGNPDCYYGDPEDRPEILKAAFRALKEGGEVRLIFSTLYFYEPILRDDLSRAGRYERDLQAAGFTDFRATDKIADLNCIYFTARKPQASVRAATEPIVNGGSRLTVSETGDNHRSEIRGPNFQAPDLEWGGRAEIGKWNEYRNGARARSHRMLRYNRELTQLFDDWHMFKGQKGDEFREQMGSIFEAIREYADRFKAFADKIGPDEGVETFAGEKKLYEESEVLAAGDLPEASVKKLKKRSDLLASKIEIMRRQFPGLYAAQDTDGLVALNRRITGYYKARIKAQLLQVRAYLMSGAFNSQVVLAVLAAVSLNYLKLSHEYGWQWRRAVEEAGIRKIRVVGFEGRLRRVYDYGNFRIIQEASEAGKEPAPVTILQDRWVREELEDGSYTYVPRPTPILLKDLDTAYRSQVHTLVSQEEDYAQILSRISDLDYWADMLETCGGFLPDYYKSDMEENLDRVLNDTPGGLNHGTTDQKAIAADNIDTAVSKLEAGDLKNAAGFFKAAVTALESRLTDIERKKRGVASRADSLAHKIRQEETGRAADELKILLEGKRYKEGERLLELLYKIHYLPIVSGAAKYFSLQQHISRLKGNFRRLAYRVQPVERQKEQILGRIREDLRRVRVMTAKRSEARATLYTPGVYKGARSEMRGMNAPVSGAELVRIRKDYPWTLRDFFDVAQKIKRSPVIELANHAFAAYRLVEEGLLEIVQLLEELDREGGTDFSSKLVRQYEDLRRFLGGFMPEGNPGKLASGDAVRAEEIIQRWKGSFGGFKERYERTSIFEQAISHIQQHQELLERSKVQALLEAISEKRRNVWRLMEHWDLIAGGHHPDGILELHLDLNQVIQRAYLQDKDHPRWSHRYQPVRFIWELGEVPLLEGDTVRLQNAFMELIRNAAGATVRYTAEGGFGEFVPIRHESVVKIATVYEPGTGEAVIRIADNGVGMTEETKKNMWLWAFSGNGNAAFGGRGIGVKTALQTVQDHGGSMAVSSSPDRGTTLTIRLPVKAVTRPIQASEPRIEERPGVEILYESPSFWKAMKFCLFHRSRSNQWLVLEHTIILAVFSFLFLTFPEVPWLLRFVFSFGIARGLVGFVGKFFNVPVHEIGHILSTYGFQFLGLAKIHKGKTIYRVEREKWEEGTGKERKINTRINFVIDHTVSIRAWAERFHNTVDQLSGFSLTLVTDAFIGFGLAAFWNPDICRLLALLLLIRDLDGASGDFTRAFAPSLPTLRRKLLAAMAGLDEMKKARSGKENKGSRSEVREDESSDDPKERSTSRIKRSVRLLQAGSVPVGPDIRIWVTGFDEDANRAHHYTRRLGAVPPFVRLHIQTQGKLIVMMETRYRKLRGWVHPQGVGEDGLSSHVWYFGNDQAFVIGSHESMSMGADEKLVRVLVHGIDFSKRSVQLDIEAPRAMLEPQTRSEMRSDSGKADRIRQEKADLAKWIESIYKQRYPNFFETYFANLNELTGLDFAFVLAEFYFRHTIHEHPLPEAIGEIFELYEELKGYLKSRWMLGQMSGGRLAADPNTAILELFRSVKALADENSTFKRQLLSYRALFMVLSLIEMGKGSQRLPYLNHPDAAINQAPYVDIATELNGPRLLPDLVGSERSVIFVDPNPKVGVYLQKSIDLLGVQDHVRILPENAFKLKQHFKPESIGTIRLRSVGAFLKNIPSDWFEDLARLLVPGGQIIFSYYPQNPEPKVVSHDEFVNSLDPKNRQLLQDARKFFVGQKGWDLAYGHMDRNHELVKGQEGYEATDGFFAETVFAFTKPARSEARKGLTAEGQTRQQEEIFRDLRQTIEKLGPSEPLIREALAFEKTLAIKTALETFAEVVATFGKPESGKGRYAGVDPVSAVQDPEVWEREIFGNKLATLKEALSLLRDGIGDRQKLLLQIKKTAPVVFALHFLKEQIRAGHTEEILKIWAARSEMPIGAHSLAQGKRDKGGKGIEALDLSNPPSNMAERRRSEMHQNPVDFDTSQPAFKEQRRAEMREDKKKIGRNDPCPCGSGKKYKHCHLRLEEQRQQAAAGPVAAFGRAATELDGWIGDVLSQAVKTGALGMIRPSPEPRIRQRPSTTLSDLIVSAHPVKYVRGPVRSSEEEGRGPLFEQGRNAFRVDFHTQWDDFSDQPPASVEKFQGVVREMFNNWYFPRALSAASPYQGNDLSRVEQVIIERRSDRSNWDRASSAPDISDDGRTLTIVIGDILRAADDVLSSQRHLLQQKPLPVTFDPHRFLGEFVQQGHILETEIQDALDAASWKNFHYDLVSGGRGIVIRLKKPFEYKGIVYTAIKLKGIHHEVLTPPVMLQYRARRSKEDTQGYEVAGLGLDVSGRIELKEEPTPFGGVMLDTAKNETEYLEYGFSDGLTYDIPLGTGEYTTQKFEGMPTGFVMSLIPDPAEERTTDMISKEILRRLEAAFAIVKESRSRAHERLAEAGGMAGMRNYMEEHFEQMGRAIRDAHDKGYQLETIHFGNMVERADKNGFVWKDLARWQRRHPDILRQIGYRVLDLYSCCAHLSQHPILDRRSGAGEFVSRLGVLPIVAIMRGYFYDRLHDNRIGNINGGDVGRIFQKGSEVPVHQLASSEPLVALMRDVVQKKPIPSGALPLLSLINLPMEGSPVDDAAFESMINRRECQAAITKLRALGMYKLDFGEYEIPESRYFESQKGHYLHFLIRKNSSLEERYTYITQVMKKVADQWPRGLPGNGSEIIKSPNRSEIRAGETPLKIASIGKNSKYPTYIVANDLYSLVDDQGVAMTVPPRGSAYYKQWTASPFEGQSLGVGWVIFGALELAAHFSRWLPGVEPLKKLIEKGSVILIKASEALLTPWGEFRFTLWEERAHLAISRFSASQWQAIRRALQDSWHPDVKSAKDFVKARYEEIAEETLLNEALAKLFYLVFEPGTSVLDRFDLIFGRDPALADLLKRLHDETFPMQEELMRYTNEARKFFPAGQPYMSLIQDWLKGRNFPEGQEAAIKKTVDQLTSRAEMRDEKNQGQAYFQLISEYLKLLVPRNQGPETLKQRINILHQMTELIFTQPENLDVSSYLQLEAGRISDVKQKRELVLLNVTLQLFLALSLARRDYLRNLESLTRKDLEQYVLANRNFREDLYGALRLFLKNLPYRGVHIVFSGSVARGNFILGSDHDLYFIVDDDAGLPEDEKPLLLNVLDRVKMAAHYEQMPFSEVHNPPGLPPLPSSNDGLISRSQVLERIRTDQIGRLPLLIKEQGLLESWLLSHDPVLAREFDSAVTGLLSQRTPWMRQMILNGLEQEAEDGYFIMSATADVKKAFLGIMTLNRVQTLLRCCFGFDQRYRWNYNGFDFLAELHNKGKITGTELQSMIRMYSLLGLVRFHALKLFGTDGKIDWDIVAKKLGYETGEELRSEIFHLQTWLLDFIRHRLNELMATSEISEPSSGVMSDAYLQYRLEQIKPAWLKTPIRGEAVRSEAREKGGDSDYIYGDLPVRQRSRDIFHVSKELRETRRQGVVLKGPDVRKYLRARLLEEDPEGRGVRARYFDDGRTYEAEVFFSEERIFFSFSPKLHYVLQPEDRLLIDYPGRVVLVRARDRNAIGQYPVVTLEKMTAQDSVRRSEMRDEKAANGQQTVVPSPTPARAQPGDGNLAPESDGALIVPLLEGKPRPKPSEGPWESPFLEFIDRVQYVNAWIKFIWVLEEESWPVKVEIDPPQHLLSSTNASVALEWVRPETWRGWFGHLEGIDSSALLLLAGVSGRRLQVGKSMDLGETKRFMEYFIAAKELYEKLLLVYQMIQGLPSVIEGLREKAWVDGKGAVVPISNVERKNWFVSRVFIKHPQAIAHQALARKVASTVRAALPKIEETFQRMYAERSKVASLDDPRWRTMEDEMGEEERARYRRLRMDIKKELYETAGSMLERGLTADDYWGSGAKKSLFVMPLHFAQSDGVPQGGVSTKRSEMRDERRDGGRRRADGVNTQNQDTIHHPPSDAIGATGADGRAEMRGTKQDYRPETIDHSQASAPTVQPVVVPGTVQAVQLLKKTTPSRPGRRERLKITDFSLLFEETELLKKFEALNGGQKPVIFQARFSTKKALIEAIGHMPVAADDPVTYFAFELTDLCGWIHRAVVVDRLSVIRNGALAKSGVLDDLGVDSGKGNYGFSLHLIEDPEKRNVHFKAIALGVPDWQGQKIGQAVFQNLERILREDYQGWTLSGNLVHRASEGFFRRFNATYPSDAVFEEYRQRGYEPLWVPEDGGDLRDTPDSRRTFQVGIIRSEMRLNPVDSRTSQPAAEEGRRSEMREQISDQGSVIRDQEKLAPSPLSLTTTNRSEMREAEQVSLKKDYPWMLQDFYDIAQKIKNSPVLELANYAMLSCSLVEDGLYEITDLLKEMDREAGTNFSSQLAGQYDELRAFLKEFMPEKNAKGGLVPGEESLAREVIDGWKKSFEGFKTRYERASIFEETILHLQQNRELLERPKVQALLEAISQKRRNVWRLMEHWDLIANRANPDGILDLHLDLNQTIRSAYLKDKDHSRWSQRYQPVKFIWELGEITLTEGDAVRLQNAFIELIRNAAGATVRYTAESGFGEFVPIRNESIVRISSSYEPATEQNVVRIQDNGVGMNEEEKKKMWLWAFSGHGVAAFGGRGIGAKTALQTVKEHGGSISVESNPETGTEVIIKLPVKVIARLPNRSEMRDESEDGGKEVSPAWYVRFRVRTLNHDWAQFVFRAYRAFDSFLAQPNGLKPEAAGSLSAFSKELRALFERFVDLHLKVKDAEPFDAFRLREILPDLKEVRALVEGVKKSALSVPEVLGPQTVKEINFDFWMENVFRFMEEFIKLENIANENGALEEVDLEYLIKSAFGGSMKWVQKEILIAEDGELRHFKSYYPTALFSCFQILKNNSLEHAFVIDGKYRLQGGRVRVSADIEGDEAVIRFSDNGQGMPAEGLEIVEPETGKQRAFLDSFTTSDKNEKASHGEGLAIVWDIVRAHRGTIRIDSEPGKGTTFTIRLPLATKKASSSARPVADETDTETKTARSETRTSGLKTSSSLYSNRDAINLSQTTVGVKLSQPRVYGRKPELRNGPPGTRTRNPSVAIGKLYPVELEGRSQEEGNIDLPISQEKYDINKTIRQGKKTTSPRPEVNFDAMFEVKEPVVFVMEQTEINALSRSEMRELMGLAAINKEKLHLVIPDLRGAGDSARVNELRQLGVQIHGDLPEVTKRAEVRVISFSDAGENIETFKTRLGPKIAGRTSAYFGTGQPGNFAIALLFALQNIRRAELREQNGYLFGTGRLMEQALQTLWNALTVVSSAA